MKLLLSISAILPLVALSAANVEKTIFIGPDPILIEAFSPHFEDLNLITLSTTSTSVNTQLPRIFPNQTHKGVSSWLLLENLTPTKRHEVRVCWAATEPTEFWVETFHVKEVFETPSLISDLAAYSEQRAKLEQNKQPSSQKQARDVSLLFLRIISAADYFTTDESLMRQPPSVNVDIILDPYFLSVFPESLFATAAYILIIAIISWPLSGAIWRWLDSIAQPDDKPHKD